MGRLNCPVKWLVLMQAITQDATSVILVEDVCRMQMCCVIHKGLNLTVWRDCRAQTDGTHLDSWNFGGEHLKADLEQDYGGNYNSQKDILELEDSTDLRQNNYDSNYEPDNQWPLLDDYSSRDYSVYKRGAAERRERGKRRKARRKNKYEHGKMLRKQYALNKISAAQSNITDKDNKKYREPKYGKSKYISKSPKSNGYKNTLVDSSIKVDKTSDYSKSPDRIKEKNKVVPEEEAREPSAVVTSNPKYNVVTGKITDDLETSTNGKSYDSDENHKKGHNKNLKQHIAVFKGVESEVENDLQIKKHSKGKNVYDKYFKSNNNDQENKENIGYIEKLRKTTLNKLAEIKSHKEDTPTYDVDGGSAYANISVIKQCFQDSAERKYYDIKDSGNSKRKNKNCVKDSERPEKPIFSDKKICKSHNWIFSGRQNENKYPNFKDDSALRSNHNGPESNDISDKQQHGNSATDENYNTNKEETLKSENEFSETPQAVYISQNKANVQLQPLKNDKYLDRKKPSIHVLSKTGHKHVTKEKNEKRAKKKRPDKSATMSKSNSESGLSDNIKDSPVDSSRTDDTSDGFFPNIITDAKEELNSVRHERDIKKNKQKPKSYKSGIKYGGRNPFFSQFLSSGKHDEQIRSDKNEELDNSDTQEVQRYAGPETDYEDEIYQPRTRQENEENIHSAKYAKRNKYGIQQQPSDSDDDGKKLFARKAHVSKYNGDESCTTEHCVEYKAERVTNRRSSTEAVCTTTPERIRTSCTTKRNNKPKGKTTPTCSDVQLQSTKKVDNENDSSSGEGVTDEYEQFLCGQLADAFVSAVLSKVQRSRKMAKELGFTNDTDEACDRCIETRPTKIPDLDYMRNSLGKCSRGYGAKQNYSRCYSVPKPLESFLYLLLSYEKEYENSVYNKIRDESSFIFTGDYPESLARNDNGLMSDKHDGNRDSFSKESFDKQRLREENNEEKSDDQILNRNALDNIRHTYPPEEKGDIDITTETLLEEREEVEAVTKSNVRKDTNYKEDEAGERNSLLLDENLKGSDMIDVFDSQDLTVPVRRKYSTYKEPQADDFAALIDTNPGKRRRKVYKNDKYETSKLSRTNDRGMDSKVETKFGNEPYVKEKYNFLNPYPVKGDSLQHNQFRGGPGEDAPYGTVRRGFHAYQPHDSVLYNQNNKLLPSHYAPDNGVNRQSKKSDYYGYFPTEYFDGQQFYQNADGKQPYPASDGFADTDWEAGEYQLYPGDPSRHAESNPLNLVPRNYIKHADTSLRMVKRDTEPDKYEDEIVFFEIPDIEYDLY